MLKAIEVLILDENMQLVSAGFEYRSLIWKRRYYECGKFELYVAKNVYKPSWKYVYTNDRPEMGVIETVCATDDVHAWGGIDTVKVSGKFAEKLMGKKVLTPARVTGYGSEGDNVAVSMKWAEELHGDRFTYLAPDFEGVTRAMAPKPGNYDSILYDELKMAEASYRVLYDFVGNTWTVQPWRGLDRTQSQGGGIVPDPEPPVPDEPTIDDLYEPLDYIVATGEQWIDTGVNSAYELDIDIRFLDKGIYGIMGQSASAGFYFGVSPDGLYYLGGSSAPTVSALSRQLVSVVSTDSELTLTVGGETVSRGKSTTTSNTLKIMGGFSNLPLWAACYGYVLNVDGAVAQSCVPKRRIADGAVGMLDLVNEVFYTSASGVAFLAPGELPAGYTRLEYIESTGGQYIDTGVCPNQSTRLVMNARITSFPTSTQAALFGARASNTNQFWCYYRYNDKQIAWRYASKTTNYLVDDTLAVEKTVDADANVFSIGDASVTAVEATFTSAYSIFLFAVNSADEPQYPCNAAIRDCRIYQDGTALTSDYVSAKNSNGEAGMFDLVTMTFHEDASGTGFVAGPEVAEVAEAAEVSTFALTRTVAAIEETTETTAINSFALFSDQFGNIRDYVAIRDASGYKNTCLIDYEYEEPASWNDDGTPYAAPIYEWIEESQGTASELVGYQIHYNIKRGTLIARIADDLPDDEAYLDLTGTKPPYDGKWSRSQYQPDALPDFPTDMRASYAAFPAALEAEGFKHLQANFPYVEEIDTGELSTGGYLRRWDLGDKVDALLLDIGIDMEARITGVDEVYEGATRSVTPIIGEKKHRRI